MDVAPSAVNNDLRINWLGHLALKHRELRGLASAGRSNRGFRGKGHLYHKNRPSRRATWKMKQQPFSSTLSLIFYCYRMLLYFPYVWSAAFVPLYDHEPVVFALFMLIPFATNIACKITLPCLFFTYISYTARFSSWRRFPSWRRLYLATLLLLGDACTWRRIASWRRLASWRRPSPLQTRKR